MGRCDEAALAERSPLRPDARSCRESVSSGVGEPAHTACAGMWQKEQPTPEPHSPHTTAQMHSRCTVPTWCRAVDWRERDVCCATCRCVLHSSQHSSLWLRYEMKSHNLRITNRATRNRRPDAPSGSAHRAPRRRKHPGRPAGAAHHHQSAYEGALCNACPSCTCTGCMIASL